MDNETFPVVEEETPVEQEAPVTEEETPAPIETPAPPQDTSTPIALLDKKYPPIEVRDTVLRGVYPADLITWAKSLGAEVTDREDAIDAILCHEYGMDKLLAFKSKEK